MKSSPQPMGSAAALPSSSPEAGGRAGGFVLSKGKAAPAHSRLPSVIHPGVKIAHECAYLLNLGCHKAALAEAKKLVRLLS